MRGDGRGEVMTGRRRTGGVSEREQEAEGLEGREGERRRRVCFCCARTLVGPWSRQAGRRKGSGAEEVVCRAAGGEESLVASCQV